jgi:UDP-N-acetylglucosamine 2-epimerase (non-hydrolysing)
VTPLLNVLIGTRGQFVKTAPVLLELDKRNVTYRLINTGQHTASSGEMATVFGVRHGDVFLTRLGSDITSIRRALFWFSACIVKGMCLRRANRDCAGRALVVHGDTLSTLAGCLLSFFWRQRLVHIESGLTTRSLLTPFPEEIIRRISMACAHVLYAPNEWAADNCARSGRLGAKGTVVCSGANTVLDSVRRFAGRAPGADRQEPYGVVTLHRNETFYSRTNAKAAVDALNAVGKNFKLLFVMHKLTERRLKKYGLFEPLTGSGMVEILGYRRYDEFMAMVSHASFVITDGGGLQEETYYLDVPCLVLRNKTERPEGLDSSAMLSATNTEAVTGFIATIASRRHLRDFSRFHPSVTIADHLFATFSPRKAPG